MRKGITLAILICTVFFLAYTTLSIVRHNNYGSFGFDLGIYDQIVWEYAHFKNPITTVHHYPFTSIFTDHIELTLIPLSISYWIWDDPRMLLILQALLFTSSGMAIFLLAQRKKINYFTSICILIAYEIFFGVQNAMWFEVHSLSFATAFIAWFIYFLDKSSIRWSIVFFLLAVLTKEDIGLLVFLICASFLIADRKNLLKKRISGQSKLALWFMAGSVLYSVLIFYIWFPYFTADGYRFVNKGGLLSDLNPSYFADTETKRKIIFTSLASFGGLPILAPFYLFAWLGDLAHYFVLGHTVPTAQDFFMHYRISLAPLLAWPTIIAVSKFKKLNKWYIGAYILLCALYFQYSLHLPLSYLGKSWFWTRPSSVNNIESIISQIPENASVVSQNNITPHISHRDQIFTLIPEKRDTGPFLTWPGNPKYLIIDTSKDFDIRHFLLNREEFAEAVKNTEKEGLIKEYKRKGNTVLYKILKTQ
jgi:uncharacterized membrane protein